MLNQLEFVLRIDDPLLEKRNSCQFKLIRIFEFLPNCINIANSKSKLSDSFFYIQYFGGILWCFPNSDGKIVSLRTTNFLEWRCSIYFLPKIRYNSTFSGRMAGFVTFARLFIWNDLFCSLLKCLITKAFHNFLVSLVVSNSFFEHTQYLPFFQVIWELFQNGLNIFTVKSQVAYQFFHIVNLDFVNRTFL